MRGLLLALLLLNLDCGAKERAIVCARHQYRNEQWSSMEKARATLVKGAELNQASGSFHYNSLSTYVVLDLDEDSAVIIEMSLPQLGPVAVEGTDRDGRRWQVTRSNTCS